MVEGRKKKKKRERESRKRRRKSALTGEEGLDRTYGSPCNRRLRRRARARGFRRSLCLCVSGVPEGASENEGSGRWMRSERKVVVLLVLVAG